ncbi:MAG: SsrA-binding protein SmpB [Clostridia bacterium]|nr:SsrA-binding protein SmpB [Clostridia bacterium]
MKTIATNKKAHFEYFILKKFEAGISLQGSEVKSIREGNVSLKESFVIFRNGEAFINNMFIKNYDKTGVFKPDERRQRKLLLHKEEIANLTAKVAEKGLTVVPLSLYLEKHLVKLEIALCKGKLLHDKRESIKERDIQRDIRRELKAKNC